MMDKYGLASLQEAKRIAAQFDALQTVSQEYYLTYLNAAMKEVKTLVDKLADVEQYMGEILEYNGEIATREGQAALTYELSFNRGYHPVLQQGGQPVG